MSIAKHISKLGRHLPIHPQWLLGTHRLNPSIGKLRGIVLDVGCADRWIKPHLSNEATYIGLDYPPTGSTLYSASPDVFADAAHLPFATASIDAIVCLEVLEHTRDHRAALHEFFRTLKPKSVLVLSIPFMYPIHDAPHDYQRLTEHGLRRDIAEAGFEILALKKNGHSIRTAGLLFNLALVGGLYEKRRLLGYVMLPFAAFLVLIINLASLALSWILPDWSALGFGYEVEAAKP
jgi:SAM-dependent methyltransferase